MNIKIICLLFLCFASIPSEAQNTALELCLKQHGKAFLNLKKVLNQIQIKTSTKIVGDYLIDETTYSFKSQDAYNFYYEYKDAITALGQKLAESAYTRGLILGCFGALCDIIRFVIQEDNKIHIPVAITPSIISFIAMWHIVSTNKKMQAEPFFGVVHLSEHKNYFSNMSAPTISRLFSTVFATNLSFFGLRYMIGAFIEQAYSGAKYL